MEPGASDALTQGFTERPFSTAFLATSPAATNTDGFEVFVQLVMAAMTTEPCFRSCDDPVALAAGAAGAPSASFFFGLISEGSAASNDFLALNNPTRSCGRLGPATLGSTLPRSRSRVSV